MKYKDKVVEFVNKNFAGYKTDIILDSSDEFMVNVGGFNKNHGFSIRLSTWRSKEVALFGYNYEEMLDMNEENLASLFELALKIKQFGTRMVFNVNGDRTYGIDFVDSEPLTPERAVKIYREHKLSCGEEVLPCILECSNFDGSINFSVQVF